MGTEYGIRCIVRQRIVAAGRHDIRLIAAGNIAAHPNPQRTPPPGDRREFLLPLGEECVGRFASEQHILPVVYRRLRFRLKPGHRACQRAVQFSGRPQGEAAPGLQQYILGIHQRVADGPIGALTEVTALSVLQMRTARKQLHRHVRQRRASQHALVGLFQHMGFNQPLPVQRKVIHMAPADKAYAAAPLRRDEPHMHLGVVPQRLVMPHAYAGRGDGLLVQHPGRAEGDLQTEAVLHLLAHNLQLNSAHHAHGDAPGGLADGQGGFLILQYAQHFQHPEGWGDLAVPDEVSGHHGFHQEGIMDGHAGAVAGPDTLQAGNGHQVTRPGLIHGAIAAPVINAQLVDLLPAG